MDSEEEKLMTSPEQSPTLRCGHGHSAHDHSHGAHGHDHKKDSYEDDLPSFVKSKMAMKKQNQAAMKKLIIVTVLSAVFMTIEIIGGVAAHSIAVISDAAHLCSDVLGLALSVFALAIA